MRTIRTTTNRSRADSKGPFGRLEPLASPPSLPKSREKSVTTLLVSLNSIVRRTMAVVFSVATRGAG